MINLPTLTRFSGDVPDRANMDREQFATATYYYLRYINDSFVPDAQNLVGAINTQLNDFSAQMNAIKSDTQTLKDDTASIKQQTAALRDETRALRDQTQGYRDDAQSFKTEAGQYRDLAKNYANADQGVEVEPGYYSAKHWALKAQNLANDTAAILPDGAINDSAVSSNATWSSQKLDTDLAKANLSNVAASAILGKVLEVDGEGSGLDADMLDGKHASEFALASHNHDSRYLGKTAKAVDSGKLDGMQPSSANSANTIVQRDANGNFSAGTITATLNGNASTATKLKTARTIALSGDVSGSASFDGSGNVTISTTVVNNASHNHDDRYYTKSQSDGRYLGKTAKAADSDKLDGYDSSQFDRLYHYASANVGGGWLTVASTGSGRWYGEIYVMDTDSGDHSFIHLTWMRSYADTNVSVLNVGGHSNRITGVRVLYDTNDQTYGTKYLQVYVTTQSYYEVRIYGKQLRSGWNVPNIVTPVVQNSISGYSVWGSKEINNLDLASIGAMQGIANAGDLIFTGMPTTSSQGIGIKWTAFDKESTGDYSDYAHIRQITNAGGLSGSVLEIKQMNDANDGVLITTASNTGFRHNGYVVWTAGNDGSGSGLDADLLDGKQTQDGYSANTIPVRNSDGDIRARLFRSNYATQTSTPGSGIQIAFRNSTSDDYIRFVSASAFKDWLENVLGVGGMKIKNRFQYRGRVDDSVIDLGFSPDWNKVHVTLSGNYGGQTASGWLKNEVVTNNSTATNIISVNPINNKKTSIIKYSDHEIYVRGDSGEVNIVVIEFA